MAESVALHVCFRNGFRWPLRDEDEVQVWTVAHQLVATLPARLIRHLVELHLAGAALQSQTGELLRRPPVRLPPRIVAKPFDRTARAALRQQRRSRGK